MAGLGKREGGGLGESPEIGGGAGKRVCLACDWGMDGALGLGFFGSGLGWLGRRMHGGALQYSTKVPTALGERRGHACIF